MIHLQVTYHFAPYVITDGNLVTGQNPGAARETAKQVLKRWAQRDRDELIIHYCDSDDETTQKCTDSRFVAPSHRAKNVRIF